MREVCFLYALFLFADLLFLRINFRCPKCSLVMSVREKDKHVELAHTKVPQALVARLIFFLGEDGV